MIWTKELPRRPGWYWCGDGQGCHWQIVHVFHSDGKMQARGSDGVTRRVAVLSKNYPLWAGPLAIPEEPKGELDV